ncbi:MAG TPA: hypothetical protein VE669_01655, partial [Actinomycetota bacterium]|nr:hypothetical protein [Actinomycetota bacterium]
MFTDRRGRRFPWIITLGALGLALLWTLLILLLPQLRFALPLPALGSAIETAGVVVAGIAAALAYVRYSLTGAGTWVAVSVAFVVIGLNQLVFGLALSPDSLGDRLAVYAWNAGRLLVGALLLLGARRLGAPPAPGGRLARFVSMTFWSLVVLAATETTLWVLRDSLPPLTTAPRALARGATGALPGLTPTVVVLGVVGTLLFLTAAFVIVRGADREGGSAWLPPALVLAAMSHVHYMLFPTAFTDRVSTGDLLRLAFTAVVLAGIVWEIHRLSASERARALELEAAYRAERERARQLEEVDRSREELFSILTHELMHPVAGVRGALVTLVRRWDDLDESVRREMLDRGERESARLRDLAEEAATALQLEDASFTVHPRPLDVAGLV